MSARIRVDVQVVATAFTVAAGVAVALWLIFATIAHPSRVSARMADLDRRLDEADRLAATATGPLTQPPGAICHQEADSAVAALKQRLQANASANGLTLSNLAVSPGAGDEALAGLTPITFSLEANGRYDAVVTMIAGLGKAEPELFVDQADLKSQTSSVDLKFSGRLYCLTTAP